MRSPLIETKVRAHLTVASCRSRSSAFVHICRAPVVLSKEEVDAERVALRAVDARPIKKVAEARLRKRKRLSVSCVVHLAPQKSQAAIP